MGLFFFFSDKISNNMTASNRENLFSWNILLFTTSPNPKPLLKIETAKCHLLELSQTCFIYILDSSFSSSSKLWSSIVWIKTNNNNKTAILWLFLAIFPPPVCLSFTKPRFRQSLGGAQWDYILIGSKFMASDVDGGLERAWLTLAILYKNMHLIFFCFCVLCHKNCTN